LTTDGSAFSENLFRRRKLHPKAMPAILTQPDEIDAWLTAPQDAALRLQRPLPSGTLRIVARRQKEDGALPAA
jgi:putative SOS response-associated peptidase YedK